MPVWFITYTWEANVRGILDVNKEHIEVLHLWTSDLVPKLLLNKSIPTQLLRLHDRKSERKVGVFYRGVVKVERFLRCTTCNESRKVSGEKNMEVSLHDDDDGIINWTDVSSAINFVSFLTMLWFEITAMTIIITTLIGGVLWYCHVVML